VLGVVGDVVPPVALVVVGGVGRVTVLLLLGDERPLLVELDLTGPRGKKPRAPGERRGRAGRRPGQAGQRGPGGRRRAARWGGCRTPRRGVQVPRRPSPRAGGSGTAGCPCARRSGPGRRCSRAAGTACACRGGRRPRGCRRRAGRGASSRGS